MLRVEDLQVVYRTAAGDVPAVDRVSFSLQPGQRLGLIGESGSGKTTMATALMRLTRPPGRIVGGRVLLGDTDLLPSTTRQLRQVRLRDIALVPQGAMNSLNPVMRVEDQIIDAIVAHEGKQSAQGARRPRHRAARSASACRRRSPVAIPHELSGGMKQRAVMAISTALDPKVIVADEPTSALDVVVQRQVMQTLGRLQEGIGSAVVLIGHDMGLIAQFADLIGVMYAGRLVEIGPVDDILAEPAPPVHPAAHREPAAAHRQGQARGHPGAAAGAAEPASRLRLQPTLPVRLRPVHDGGPARHRRGPLAASRMPPVPRAQRPAAAAVVGRPRPGRPDGRGQPRRWRAARSPARGRPGRARGRADGGMGHAASPGDSARGVTGLAQSDIDEMHRGGRS